MKISRIAGFVALSTAVIAPPAMASYGEMLFQVICKKHGKVGGPFWVDRIAQCDDVKIAHYEATGESKWDVQCSRLK